MSFLGTRPDSSTTAHQTDSFTAGDVDDYVFFDIGRCENVLSGFRMTGTNSETAANEGNVVAAVDIKLYFRD